MEEKEKEHKDKEHKEKEHKDKELKHKELKHKDWDHEDPSSDEHLTHLLIQSCHMVSYQRMMQTEQGQSQDKVLQILAEGPISQKELQEKLNIKAGSVSELVSKLESKHMVERRRDEKDKRRVILAITHKGYHVSHEVMQRSKEELYRCLTSEEKDEMRRILEKLLVDWKGSGKGEKNI